MKTTIRSFLVVAFLATICMMLTSGCGNNISSDGSGAKTMSIAIHPDVTLEMVQCPNGLWFGKYEVTQAQWNAVMGENPSLSNGENNPVETVSWNDCQKFLKNLNSRPAVKKSSLVFRLPTEEEWEYACRAGATGKYCNLGEGTEITEETLGQVSWFEDNSNDKTHPVGQKTPNAFGLYDMHGNVWEWSSTTVGIVCGGSCGDSAEDCESSNRSRELLTFRSHFLGFRLCATDRNDGISTSEEVASNSAAQNAAANWSQSKQVSDIIPTLFEDMVAIPGKNYMIGRHEVTQAQWDTIMRESPSLFNSESNPVNNVSWNECQLFLKELNALSYVEKSVLVFRLPTEEEWEFACRAGAVGDYCRLADGTEITEETLGQVAWFGDNSKRETHPVGQKTPNAFGLYDMHGNVSEWTQTATFVNRIFRSGSCRDSAKRCESSFREGSRPSYRSSLLGFRLCASNRRASDSDLVKLLENMVSIPGKDYKMGKFEVTHKQWRAVMGDPEGIYKGFGEAVQVPWYDCQDFLKKLNALPIVKGAGLTFRLPTAEEWEYACRAGATGDYSLLADGTEVTKETLDQVAWFGESLFDNPHPQGGGMKKPNAFGLYDMHGNVWEWTSTASFGGSQVVMGGDRCSTAEMCKPSCRYTSERSGGLNRNGFRLCAEATAK